jgi:alkylhydroperoxidase family enzyme
LLDSLRRGEILPTLPTRVQALLRFAQSASTLPTPVLLEDLRTAGLSDIEVQEAVAVIAVFTLINTWTDIMAIPIDSL